MSLAVLVRLARMWEKPHHRVKTATYVALSLVIACGAVWQLATARDIFFPVDDAYITLHNAQVLLHGPDNRFVGTPALGGATSPVHVVVTAVALPLLSPERALLLAAWGGALAYVLALARLAFALSAGPVVAVMLVAAGLLIGETPHQLFNGLETGWAMAAVAWALTVAGERTVKRPWELPLGCGVLPFIRPELAVLSILLLLLRAFDSYRDVKRRAELGRLVCFDLAWAGIGAAPWLGLLWWNTGAPIVGTIAAKRNFFAEGCLPDAVKATAVGLSLTKFAWVMAPLTVAAPLWLFHRAGRLAVAFGAALVAAYYADFPGALTHYEQRYLYVLAPALLLGPLIPLATGLTLGRIAGSALLAIVLFESAAAADVRWRQHLRSVEFTRWELMATAQWLGANAAPADIVLVHDAGAVGVVGDYRIIDLVGLKTPASLPAHAEITWPSCGARRGEALLAIVNQHKPRYLVLLNGWDRSYKLSRAVKAGGWRLSRRTNNAYSIYELSRPADLQASTGSIGESWP